MAQTFNPEHVLVSETIGQTISSAPFTTEILARLAADSLVAQLGERVEMSALMERKSSGVGELSDAYFVGEGEKIGKIRDVLDTVPDGVSVASTTFYTTYLSRRDILYDVRYASQEHIFSCEYMVLSVTDKNSYKPYAAKGEKGYENFRDLVLERGYEKIAEYKGRLEIYKKP